MRPVRECSVPNSYIREKRPLQASTTVMVEEAREQREVICRPAGPVERRVISIWRIYLHDSQEGRNIVGA